MALPKSTRAWLGKELNRWQTEEIISQDQARRIADLYRITEKRTLSPSFRLLLAGVFGSVMIGIGVILLFAHNWSDISRPARTLLSFLPLLLAQGVGIYTLVKRFDSPVWREVSGALISLATGACIALISQTYHIPGNTDVFLMTWLLLIFPVFYLFRSFAGFMLYAFLILFWLAETAAPLLFVLMLGVGTPFVLMNLSRSAVHRAFLLWPVAIIFYGGAAATLDSSSLDRFFPVVLGSLSLLFYLIHYGLSFALSLQHSFSAQLEESRETVLRSLWRHPFKIVGVSTALILAIALSFQFERSMPALASLRLRIPDIFIILLTISPLFLIRPLKIQLNSRSALMMALPIIGLAGILTDAMELYWINYIFFNIWLAAAALLTIRLGFKRDDLAVLNAGLILLCLIIVLRMVDSSVSFLSRGLAFLIIGVLFLSANYYFLKRRV